MAESDFSVLTGSLSTGSLDRAVTAGIARPPGGGSFVYGFNAVDATPGAAALSVATTNFIPMAKGGSISAAIRRGAGVGGAPFLFMCAQSNLISAVGYMLGLSNADASRIELRKGTLGSGLPDSAITHPPTDGVLALSDGAAADNSWVHLRLDAIVNANGDVVLNVYQNDLSVNTVAAPVWTAIPGIASFIDDALSVNTGTAPLMSGRCGYGFYKEAVSKQAFFDYVAPTRQP